MLRTGGSIQKILMQLIGMQSLLSFVPFAVVVNQLLIRACLVTSRLPRTTAISAICMMTMDQANKFIIAAIVEFVVSAEQIILSTAMYVTCALVLTTRNTVVGLAAWETALSASKISGHLVNRLFGSSVIIAFMLNVSNSCKKQQ